MIKNLLFSFIILLLILVSSFTMFLPLSALIKNRKIGLRYAIPFSISTEILMGYIFYCTNTINFFPISFLIFAILANIIAYYKLRPITINNLNIKPIIAVSLFIISVVIIYTRYFDSFMFSGPGGNDSYYHLIFIKDLFNLGHLNNGYYAPGFHLFLMPIATIVPYNELYRFAGPAIGIITIISFVLLTKDTLRNKSTLMFLLVLLVLPIYNQYTMQTIYFFSSSLTFLYFLSLIILMSDTKVAQRKINYYLIIIFSIALALTVPYFFITIIPSSIIIFFIVLIFRKNFIPKYYRYLLNINLIFFFGLLISFGHVFIQSNVLHHYNGFPGIAITLPQPEGSETDTTEVVTSNKEIADKFHLPLFIENNPLLKPMVGTGYDLIRVKYIRPANTVLGLGAYLWIAFSFLLIIYALRKKNSTLLIVAALSMFFGLCTQTGLFEMSTYRGRSGWYLMMLSIFGIVLFADQLNSKKIPLYFLVGLVAISITGVFFPPTLYRSYDDEEFKKVKQIATQYPSLSIKLITDIPQLSIGANNLTVANLEPESLKYNNSLLVMEKEADGNFNTSIESDNNFTNFAKVFANNDFVIYENIKSN